VIRRAPQKALAVLLGGLLALALLEIALRLGGGAFLLIQEGRNRRGKCEGGVCRVLCLGESTTAMGGDDSWPSQLDRILNARAGGAKYAVMNRGIPGSHSSIIMARVEEDLAECRPHIVVAMMGANDREGAVPFDGKPSEGGVIERLKTGKLVRLLLYHAARRRITQTSDDIFSAHLDEVRERLSRGKLKEAEDLLRAAGVTITTKERAFMEHAMYFSTEGEVGKVRRKLEPLLGSAPARDDPEIRTILSALRGRGGQADAALMRLTGDALGKEHAWFLLGDLFLLKERPAEGAASFRRATQLGPSLARAFTELGLCLMVQGDLVAAEAALKRSLELQPPDSATIRLLHSPLGFLVDLYVRERREMDVDQLIRRAMASNPGEDRLAGIAARAYRGLGRTALAEQYDRLAAELRRDYYRPMTMRNYGRLQELLQERGVRLVCVQYPTWSVEPLKRLFPSTRGIVFVDNEEVFREALAREPYEALFTDRIYLDFGHATARGNRILAERVAEALLQGRAERGK